MTELESFAFNSTGHKQALGTFGNKRGLNKKK